MGKLIKATEKPLFFQLQMGGIFFIKKNSPHALTHRRVYDLGANHHTGNRAV
jgi:hypothetical protein